MTEKMASWSLTVFCLLAVIANLFSLFSHAGIYSWLWIYHSIVLTIFGALSVLASLKVVASKDEKISWGSLAVIVVSLIIFAGAILKDYHVPHIWLDEYSQLWRSAGDPAWNGAEEQQPPGVYIFSKALVQVFGMNKLAARLTGFIPMLFSLYLFLVLAARSTRIFVFSLIFLAFYLVDPDVRYLSLEGRAVGFGVAGMAALALAIWEFLAKPDRWKGLLVVACSYLWLSSVGMQPLSLLCLFFGLVVVFGFIKKNQGLKQLSLGLGSGLLLYLPLQYEILRVADERKKFHTSIEQRFEFWLSSEKWGRFLAYFSPENVTWLWQGLVVLALASMFVVWRSQKRLMAFLLLAFLLLYIPIFDFVYHLLVNWPLNRWYYACYLILSVFLVALALSKNFKRWWGVGIGGVTLVGALFFNDPTTYLRKISWRPDWEGVYRRLPDVGPDHRVYVFGHCSMNSWWCYNFFVGAEMLSDTSRALRGQTGPDFLYEGHLQDNGMIYDLRHDDLPRRLTIIIMVGGDWVTYDGLLRSQAEGPYEISRFDNFILISTKEKTTLKEEMPKFLSWMIDRTAKVPVSYYPYEFFVRYHVEQKDAAAAKLWYKNLLSIPGFKEAANNHPLGQIKLKDLQSIQLKLELEKL